MSRVEDAAQLLVSFWRMKDAHIDIPDPAQYYIDFECGCHFDPFEGLDGCAEWRRLYDGGLVAREDLIAAVDESLGIRP